MERILDILLGTLHVFIDYPYTVMSIVLSIILCTTVWLIVIIKKARSWVLFLPTMVSGFVTLFCLLILLQENGTNIIYTLNVFLFTIVSTFVCLFLNLAMFFIDCFRNRVMENKAS